MEKERKTPPYKVQKPTSKKGLRAGNQETARRLEGHMAANIHIRQD